MSAIEYGSYYWCVVVRKPDQSRESNSIHLHADHMSIDDSGNLIFSSSGRRPAGTDPKSHQNGNDGMPAEKTEKSETTRNDGMIYFAVASGAWNLAYAAKLQDGSPASVEYWTDARSRGSASQSSGRCGRSGIARWRYKIATGFGRTFQLETQLGILPGQGLREPREYDERKDRRT